jgi:hypothetical protein
MLLIVKSIGPFRISDEATTINQFEEQIVIGLKEMNDSEANEIWFALIFFEKWRNGMSPTLRRKSLSNRTVEEVHMKTPDGSFVMAEMAVRK